MSTDQEEGKPHFPAWQWILTVIGLYLGAFLYGLDTTITASVQTPVYEQFNSINSLAWIGLGFPLGSLASILLFGQLYEVFNIKWLVNGSILLFEAGSAVCGAAPSMNALIVDRVLAGIGGCGMYIGALTFLSKLGSSDKLFLYNALIGACWGTGAILGPVIGGAFAVSSATWRWAFYINLPLAALFSPVYLFVTPSWHPAPNRSLQQKTIYIDWIGALLNASFFIFLMASLVFAGAELPWDSAGNIALWVVTGALLVAYCVQQAFALGTTTVNRIFPVHFLRSKELVLLFIIAMACTATVNAVAIYYVPIFFAFTRGDGALQAAVRLLPYIIIFIFFVMFSGATLPLVGRSAPYYTIGSIFITVGSALFFTVRTDTSQSLLYAYEALTAIGAGLTFQNAYAVADAKVGKEDKTNAIGFMNMAQIGTTALSLAIASCLYQNLGREFLRDASAPFGFPDPLLGAALGGVGSTALASAPKATVDVATSIVAFTITRVFAINIVAGGLMLGVSLLMRQEKLDLSKPAIGG